MSRIDPNIQYKFNNFISNLTHYTIRYAEKSEIKPISQQERNHRISQYSDTNRQLENLFGIFIEDDKLTETDRKILIDIHQKYTKSYIAVYQHHVSINSQFNNLVLRIITFKKIIEGEMKPDESVPSEVKAEPAQIDSLKKEAKEISKNLTSGDQGRISKLLSEAEEQVSRYQLYLQAVTKPNLDHFLSDKIKELERIFELLRKTPISDPKYAEKIQATEKIYNVIYAISTSGKGIELGRLQKLNSELNTSCCPFIEGQNQAIIWHHAIRNSQDVTDYIISPPRLSTTSGTLLTSSSSSNSSSSSSSSSQSSITIT
jgi:hypothetical protein